MQEDSILLKIALIIILFFALLIPTSQISDHLDYGLLIKNHKQAGKEYQDPYEVLLAISTVNHENNLEDAFEISESVSYLRRLYKRKYQIEEYEDCYMNSKGEEICATRERKVMVGYKSYQGERLINFSRAKFMVESREELLKDARYKALLKFQYIFPDEEEIRDDGKKYVIEYELGHLTKEDIIYDDPDQRQWFLFLADEGVHAIYGDGEGDLIADAGGGVGGGTMPDSSSINNPLLNSQNEAVVFAKKYLGTRYEWGAPVGNTKSFDCSSFTCWIYKNVYKTNIPRKSYDQFKALEKVEKQSLQTGDLVFFYTGYGNKGDPITHTGMYIGDGKFIHASTSGGVKVSDLNSKYWKGCYRGAGRKKT